MLQNSISNFMKTHRSIISDLFLGINYNIIQCSDCGGINIYDCFDIERKVNLNNTIYGNYCKRMSQNCKCTIVVTGPEILI